MIQLVLALVALVFLVLFTFGVNVHPRVNSLGVALLAWFCLVAPIPAL